MMRVLVTVTPRMYRQAIALSIQRQRTGLEVRTASPEAAEGELAAFRPHLLVHNENDRLGSEAVEDVPCRVEVQYSDGMDAWISVDGEVSTACDMCMEDLLRIVDRATARAEQKTEQS
jgi:hypothetical protein